MLVWMSTVSSDTVVTSSAVPAPGEDTNEADLFRRWLLPPGVAPAGGAVVLQEGLGVG